MKERPIEILTQGGTLRGYLQGDPGHASTVVVLLHGWIGYSAGPHRMLYELAEALGQGGAATVRFDFLGRGDSDGRFEDTSFDQGVIDVTHARRFVGERFPGARVMLAGMCFGAAVGFHCCGLWDRMLLWSPVRLTAGPQLSTRLRALRAHGLAGLRKVFSPAQLLRLLKGQAKAAGAYRYYTKAGKLPFEVWPPRDRQRPGKSALVILGGADPACTDVQNQYQKTCTRLGIACESIVVPGADHNFCWADVKEATIPRAAAWLLGNSIPAPQPAGLPADLAMSGPTVPEDLRGSK